jgi:hypothetical protein
MSTTPEIFGSDRCLSEELRPRRLRSTVEQKNNSWVVGKLDVFAKYRHTRK